MKLNILIINFFSWTTNVLWKRYLMIVVNETSTDTPRAWGGGDLPSEPRYQAMRGLIKIRKNMNKSDFFIRPGVGSLRTPKNRSQKKSPRKKYLKYFFPVFGQTPPKKSLNRIQRFSRNPWILSAKINSVWWKQSLCSNQCLKTSVVIFVTNVFPNGSMLKRLSPMCHGSEINRFISAPQHWIAPFSVYFDHDLPWECETALKLVEERKCWSPRTFKKMQKRVNIIKFLGVEGNYQRNTCWIHSHPWVFGCSPPYEKNEHWIHY